MFDPLTLMLMASGQQQPGMGQMLNPAGSTPMPSMGMGAAPGAGAGGQAPGGMGSIGDMLAGVKAPQAADPKFSGGVSGSGLPYVSRMEDMVNPFLQASGAGKASMLPTLGALLSQAPGGGR